MTTKQFEANKVRRQILSEYEKWRDHLFDLPVILLLLNRLKEIVTLAKIKEAHSSEWKGYLAEWEDVKSRGELLARSRTLFTAAEAIGQLPPHVAIEERAQLLQNLGSLIEEGNSLHKVRALRAMIFVGSNACIPYIEQGLNDSSSWVKATALWVLLRLNLTNRERRDVILRFLFRIFWRSLTLGYDLVPIRITAERGPHARVRRQGSRLCWFFG